MTVSNPGKLGLAERIIAWNARWKHVPRVGPDCRTVAPCDVSHVRCPEEKGYQSRLAAKLTEIHEQGLRGPLQVKATLELLMYDQPLDSLYWVANRARWVHNCDMEVRWRNRPDDYIPLWHQVEYHHVRSRNRPALYPVLPKGWVDSYEVPEGLGVHGPPVLAYNAGALLQGTPYLGQAVRAIMLVEWIANVVVAFADAARNGIRHLARCKDGRLYHKSPNDPAKGRLFRLPAGVIRRARDLGLEGLMAGCKVQGSDVEILFRHVEGVDWDRHAPPEGFLWYRWDENRIVIMPERDSPEFPRVHTVADWKHHYGRSARSFPSGPSSSYFDLDAIPVGAPTNEVPTSGIIPDEDPPELAPWEVAMRQAKEGGSEKDGGGVVDPSRSTELPFGSDKGTTTVGVPTHRAMPPRGQSSVDKPRIPSSGSGSTIVPQGRPISEAAVGEVIDVDKFAEEKTEDVAVSVKAEDQLVADTMSGWGRYDPYRRMITAACLDSQREVPRTIEDAMTLSCSLIREIISLRESQQRLIASLESDLQRSKSREAAAVTSLSRVQRSLSEMSSRLRMIADYTRLADENVKGVDKLLQEERTLLDRDGPSTESRVTPKAPTTEGPSRKRPRDS